MAFWKEQPETPNAGHFRTVWDGGSFRVLVASTDVEVLRIDKGTNTVLLPAGSIPTAGLANLAVTTAKINDEAVTSAKISEDVVQVATVSLTNAEIKALNATAKELVAAPGAGKVIEFIGATLFHDYGSNALTGNHDMTIGLNDGTVAVAAVIPFADFPLQVADHVYSVKAAVAFNDAAADVLNKNLALTAAGDYAGNAGNDTVWTVNVAYRIHDFS